MLTTYDGWKPILEWDGAGNFQAYNVYGPGADEILWRYEPANGVGHLRYHHDIHGNVTALLDWGGNVLEKYSYDAFGLPRVTDRWNSDWSYGRTWSNYRNRFMFTGREYYPHLWLYDYRHRWYDMNLGRFLQTDPLGLQTEGQKLTAGQKALFSPGGVAPEAFGNSEMNLYRYCGDDPVDGSDPLGLYFPVVRNFSEEDSKIVNDELNRISKLPEYKKDFDEMRADKNLRYIEPASSKGNDKGHQKYNSTVADSESAWFTIRSWWKGGNYGGGTVYYDPHNFSTQTGKTRPPISGLAHELAHLIGIKNGTYLSSKGNDDENRARWFEGQARAAFGIDKPIRYKAPDELFDREE